MANKLTTKAQEEKIEWEQEVCFQLEEQGEMTTSDAQGIMMIHEDRIETMFIDGVSAFNAASEILFQTN